MPHFTCGNIHSDPHSQSCLAWWIIVSKSYELYLFIWWSRQGNKRPVRTNYLLQLVSVFVDATKMDLKHRELNLTKELWASSAWSLVMGLSIPSTDKLQLLTHAYINIKQLIEKLNPLSCCRCTNLVQKTIQGASKKNSSYFPNTSNPVFLYF